TPGEGGMDPDRAVPRNARPVAESHQDARDDVQAGLHLLGFRRAVTLGEDASEVRGKLPNEGAGDHRSQPQPGCRSRHETELGDTGRATLLRDLVLDVRDAVPRTRRVGPNATEMPEAQA